MIGWLLRKWDGFRIERYLKFRRVGISNRGALDASWLNGFEAKKILEREIVFELSRLGVSSGGDYGGSAETKIRYLLPALADLSEVLPERERGAIEAVVQKVAAHRWKRIRQAGLLAHQVLLQANEQKQAFK